MSGVGGLRETLRGAAAKGTDAVQLVLLGAQRASLLGHPVAVAVEAVTDEEGRVPKGEGGRRRREGRIQRRGRKS